MTELLKAATEMFQSFTALAKYMLAQEQEKAGDAPAKEEKAQVPADQQVKQRKHRAAKEEVPAAPPAAAPAAPETTDAESYAELARLAIAYIGADKPGTEARRAVAMKHVEDTYRVSALSAVPHGPQRLQLTGWFKLQLAQPAAPAGFGV